MAGAFRMALIAFCMLYVFALAIFLIGTFGLFGQDRDPLSGVFLIPLGKPWNHIVDAFPEVLWPWLAVGAPAVNLLILSVLHRFFARRRSAAR
jgi:cytochrome b561